MIDIDDFKKIDLRIATITEAEPIEGTDKMVRLMIDLGGELRQLLAGIATTYSPEDLVGKQIVVVVNLKPRIMFKGQESINNGDGLESQGMLLAVNDKDGPVLLMPEKQTHLGATIQ